MSGPSKSSPKDAQVMSAILKDMGVLDSETRLINQMLEFTYSKFTKSVQFQSVQTQSLGKINLLIMFFCNLILKIYQLQYFINNNIGIVFVSVFDVRRSWTDH